MKYYPATPTYSPEYTIEVPKNLKLKFESRFESGNLHKVIMKSENEYLLMLETDTNTHTYTQWYHFYVENTEPIDVTFHIINLEKNASLYSAGLMPLVYSKVRNQKEGTDWHRAGSNISYTPTTTYKEPSDKSPILSNGQYYTLSFTYKFEHPHDRVYFAHSYPYTYTQLQEYLSKLKKHQDIARVDPLCYTLAGNSCDVVTITENIHSYISHEAEKLQWRVTAAARRLLIRKEDFKEYKEEHGNKKVIVFTSRVHPGETVASYIIQGTIDFLLSDCREAKLLRRNFIFKIVPMLNPDGVRYGNYRCSLLGVDLNRRWINPHKILHPTIYYTKKMILTIAETHTIAMYCDVHGHSRKKNVFMYGCGLKPGDVDDRRKNVLAKMIPLLFSQRTGLFSFKDSHFRMEKSKESTARIVLYKTGIVNSYTLESTFFGPSDTTALGEGYTDGHMHKEHFDIIGQELAKVTQAFVNQAQFIRKLMYAAKVLRSSNTPCKLKKGVSKEIRSGRSTTEMDEGAGKETIGIEQDIRKVGIENEIGDEVEDVINSDLLDELEKQEETGEGNEDTSSCSGSSDHSQRELEEDMPILDKPSLTIIKETPPIRLSKSRSIKKRYSIKNPLYSPTRTNFQIVRHSTQKLNSDLNSEIPEKKTFRSNSSATLKKELSYVKKPSKLPDFNNINLIKEKLFKLTPASGSKIYFASTPWPKKSYISKNNMRKTHYFIESQAESSIEHGNFTPFKNVDSKFLSSYNSLSQANKPNKSRGSIQDSSFLSVQSVNSTKSNSSAIQTNKYKSYRILATPTVEEVYALQKGIKFPAHSKLDQIAFKSEGLSFASNKDSNKKLACDKYISAGYARLHK